MESAETYQTLSQIIAIIWRKNGFCWRERTAMDDAGQIQVVYHGELMQFDTAPQSIEYVTMVDAEAALQQMGAEVSIENGVLTAVSSGKELIFREGEQNASVNGTACHAASGSKYRGKTFCTHPVYCGTVRLSVSYNDRTRTVVLK